jgi:lysophospholipase L1-like esterase
MSVFNAIVPTENDTIFLGHSLVNEFLLREYLPEYRIMNMGIGGDNVKGLTKRLDIALKRNPKCLLVEIGINDIINEVLVDTVKQDFERMIKTIRNHTECRLIMFNIFPSGNEDRNKKVTDVNNYLAQLPEKYNFTLIDVYSDFVENNKLKLEYNCGDNTHLSGKGYIEWANMIRKAFNEQNAN